MGTGAPGSIEQLDLLVGNNCEHHHIPPHCHPCSHRHHHQQVVIKIFTNNVIINIQQDSHLIHLERDAEGLFTAIAYDFYVDPPTSNAISISKIRTNSTKKTKELIMGGSVYLT